MKTGRVTAQVGGYTKGIARQWDGSKLVHYRTHSQDLDPAIERTKQIAQSSTPGKSEYQYLGSVDRTVIDDWLRKQGKNWHDYVTDRDLKAKFLAYYRTDFAKLMAANYQERSLAINRSTAPKLGATVLKQYRAEVADIVTGGK